MLDEVAWLFNLRGTDIPFNPVFFGYGLVTMTDAPLFVDSSKLTDDVYKHLGQSVKVKPYEDIIFACQQLGQSLKQGEKVGCPIRRALGAKINEYAAFRFLLGKLHL